MDAMKVAAAPVFEDFVPTTELMQEENIDTLLLHLPGFKKEQLRVQLTRGGILRISGSRPIGVNKWSRFQKEFPVSANTDTAKITAKFEGGIMYVKQPKLITPAYNQDQKFPPAIAPEPQKPAVVDDPTKQTARDNVPDKSQDKIEEKSANEKNDTGSKETSQEEKTSLPDASADKEKKVNDKPKTDSIDAGVKKDQGSAGNEDGAGKSGLTNHRDISGAMAARLKMPRRVMNAVLVALLALLLGLYVSNWISSFKKAEN